MRRGEGAVLGGMAKTALSEEGTPMNPPKTRRQESSTLCSVPLTRSSNFVNS